MKKYLVISLIASASVLAACGGSDDAPVADAAGEAPASASASSSGLVAYLTELSLGDPNTQAQVSVASFAPPTPEDAPPEVLK